MSAETDNVAVIRSLYEAFNRTGDWKSIVPFLSEEIEMETDPRHPRAGIYRGVEAYLEFVEEFEEPYERTEIEPERYYAKGDQVVAFTHMRRRPRSSTIELDVRIGFLWTLRDGDVVREQVFGEREKALEAAGMDESDAVTVEG